MKLYGSRAEVAHGLAKMTTGRLTKNNLVLKKRRWMSKKQIKSGKNNPGLISWRAAVKDAKCQLSLPKKGTGAFIPIKGNLRNRAREIRKCGGCGHPNN